MAGTASTLTEYVDPEEQQRFLNRIADWSLKLMAKLKVKISTALDSFLTN